MIPYEITETRAIRFPMRQVFESHFRGNIEIRKDLTEEQLPQKLYVEGCPGFDGRGWHSMHSKQDTKTHNFVCGGCRYILIKDEHENCLHQEESLGLETEKPLFIQPGKDTL